MIYHVFIFSLQLLNTLANFLARKTDFFVGGASDNAWEKVSRQFICRHNNQLRAAIFEVSKWVVCYDDLHFLLF